MKTDILVNILQLPLEQLKELAEHAEENYVRFPLDKGNGKKRWIEAPKKDLKHLQTQILHKVLYKKPPHPVAHGFVPNRSIVTNAKPHVGQNWVVNFDIKDFFPSTKTPLVRDVLVKYDQFSEDDIEIILNICTRNGALPQGAPTSPHLANLALWDFDMSLWKFCLDQGLQYTRYADDLTFSGHKVPEDLRSIVIAELHKLGYRLAKGKSSYRGQHRRQIVTGLVVNEKINLPREKRKRLRAILHDIKQNGIQSALQRSSMELDQLIGHISLQSMWDEEMAQKQITELFEAIFTDDISSISE
jgi:RNA-directed DNA polymerase